MVKKNKIGQPEINVYNNFIYLNQRQKKQKHHLIIEEQNWLKLPPNIRQMEEKEEFKKSYKKALWTLMTLLGQQIIANYL